MSSAIESVAVSPAARLAPSQVIPVTSSSGRRTTIRGCAAAVWSTRRSSTCMVWLVSDGSGSHFTFQATRVVSPVSVSVAGSPSESSDTGTCEPSPRTLSASR